MFADNSGRDTGQQKILLVIECGANARGLVSGNKGETEVVPPRSHKLHLVKQKREKGYLLLHLRTG
ncbi:MAG: hypothetical protein A2138_12640 [Deltaproteobacteria bacterium RBG_16_71_12]|nr:MAG: hypothetical protein A2138_12640 [Deltaproteobacteria bacterium RBG_16_71_12]